MRRDTPDGVEFATLTLFDSMDAVKAFAGEHYETAVVPPAARALLREFERTSLHYGVVARPE